MAFRLRVLFLVTLFSSLVASYAAAAGNRLPSRSDLIVWGEVSSGFQFQVDEKRSRVWVVKRDAVYVYDVGSKNLIRRISLPGWVIVAPPHNCGPGLALLPSGEVLVTTDTLPIIWKIQPETFAVRRYDLFLDADNDKEVGFSALAYRAEGPQLVGFSGQLGSFWQIDLRSRRAHKLHTALPVYGACAHLVY